MPWPSGAGWSAAKNVSTSPGPTLKKVRNKRIAIYNRFFVISFFRVLSKHTPYMCTVTVFLSVIMQKRKCQTMYFISLAAYKHWSSEFKCVKSGIKRKVLTLFMGILLKLFFMLSPLLSIFHFHSAGICKEKWPFTGQQDSRWKSLQREVSPD